MQWNAEFVFKAGGILPVLPTMACLWSAVRCRVAQFRGSRALKMWTLKPCAGLPCLFVQGDTRVVWWVFTSELDSIATGCNWWEIWAKTCKGKKWSWFMILAAPEDAIMQRFTTNYVLSSWQTIGAKLIMLHIQDYGNLFRVLCGKMHCHLMPSASCLYNWGKALCSAIPGGWRVVGFGGMNKPMHSL